MFAHFLVALTMSSSGKPLTSVWKYNWQLIPYRRKFISGAILMSCILISLPFFYQAIEQRHGIKFNDYFLQWLPAIDLSIYIFGIIWSMALLTFQRFYQDPAIFLRFLWGFILINLARFISIGLIPLNPPGGLIPIQDPISNFFYGPHFITKDLFFSGHTSAMFLMFLCLEKKSDKILALIATVLIGIFVLIQHVHYTIDVVMAPIITYFLWLGARKITE